jgi:hypothetical protein
MARGQALTTSYQVPLLLLLLDGHLAEFFVVSQRRFFEPTNLVQNLKRLLFRSNGFFP